MNWLSWSFAYPALGWFAVCTWGSLRLYRSPRSVKNTQRYHRPPARFGGATLLPGAVDVVAEVQASDGDRAPARVTVGGRYDLEFALLATGWRITKRHMTTRYTIGDPTVLERARGARLAA